MELSGLETGQFYCYTEILIHLLQSVTMDTLVPTVLPSMHSYLECHEVSQQHDVARVDAHPVVHHGVHNLINDGLPVMQ